MAITTNDNLAFFFSTSGFKEYDAFLEFNPSLTQLRIWLLSVVLNLEKLPPAFFKCLLLTLNLETLLFAALTAAFANVLRTALELFIDLTISFFPNFFMAYLIPCFATTPIITAGRTEA